MGFSILLLLAACAGEKNIHQAVQKGKLRNVKIFLLKGIDINEPDSWGNTPLTIAASKGYIDIKKYLISKGAK